MLVNESNSKLPTPNNPRTVDYFYHVYVAVLPVAKPKKTIFDFYTVYCRFSVQRLVL